MKHIYPMQLQASLKDSLWGGHRLEEEYNKRNNGSIISESWELSCHTEGLSIITNGYYKNQTLSDVFLREGTASWGLKGEAYKDFPILIKLIDANQSLSLQVHPDDAYARRVEKEAYGKTELWYVLDAKENASLIYGCQKELSKEELQNHLNNGTILSICNKVSAKKGDVFFIEAGTLHAIGEGILIAEIQQSSNATYRVYDFDRVDAKGNKRPLHIEKALDVICRKPVNNELSITSSIDYIAPFSIRILKQCHLFQAYDIEIRSSFPGYVGANSFQHLLVLGGSLHLQSEHTPEESLSLKKGDSIFLPATLGAYHLQGEGNVLLTHL